VSLGFKDIPIVCVNVDGYYDPFQLMLKRSFADKITYKPPNEYLSMQPTASLFMCICMCVFGYVLYVCVYISMYKYIYKYMCVDRYM